MGVFHTICTFLSVIGKRFQDAGLRDVIIESGVTAKGSVSGVLEGRTYNRASRCHKLMFEALNRLALISFNSWTDEHHKEKKPIVDEFFEGLKALCDKTCEQEFKATVASPNCYCSLHTCTISGMATENSRSSGCPMLTW